MTVSSFYGNTVPAITDAGPDNPVELGIKFHSTANGWITHVRFYKSAANTGTHVVHLWGATNTVVSSATATGEVDDAWNNIPLPTPYAITSGAAFIASYHTDVGHYADDSHYFDSTVTSGQLVGPDSVSIGGNGVFGYGASGTLPTESFNASSYGVDVYFTDVDPSGRTGTVAATQAPNTMAGAGAVLVAGAVASTQNLNTVSASGASVVSGAASATQAPNVAAISGLVTNPGLTGTIQATQAANTIAGAGSVAITGSVASTQAVNIAHVFGHVGTALGPTEGYSSVLAPRSWIAVANLPARVRARPT